MTAGGKRQEAAQVREKPHLQGCREICWCCCQETTESGGRTLNAALKKSLTGRLKVSTGMGHTRLNAESSRFLKNKTVPQGHTSQLHLKKKKARFFWGKKTYQQNSKITDTSLISLPFKWLWWRHKRSREIMFKSSFSRCGAAEMWIKLEWKDVLLGKRWRWPRHLKRGSQGDGEERGF